MRVAKIVGNVGQIFARDVQPIGLVHIANRQDHTPTKIATLSGQWLRDEDKAFAQRDKIGDRFVGVDREIKLLDNGTQIGQIGFASDALLITILQRHTSNR